MDSFPFQIPADAKQPSSAFLQCEQSSLKPKKKILCCEKSCRPLACRSSAIFSLFLKQPVTFFSSSPFSACSPLSHLSHFQSSNMLMLAQHHLPSSPTKCSSMLCHFASHLPGLSFVYALMHLFTLAPLRSMPK